MVHHRDVIRILEIGGNFIVHSVITVAVGVSGDNAMVTLSSIAA